MSECTIRDNLQRCSCTYEPCERKGRCCECIAYHWRHRELPGCLFPEQVEKSYDRSLERFMRAYSS